MIIASFKLKCATVVRFNLKEMKIMLNALFDKFSNLFKSNKTNADLSTSSASSAMVSFDVCGKEAMISVSARKVIEIGELFDLESLSDYTNLDKQEACRKKLYEIYKQGRVRELYEAIFVVDLRGVSNEQLLEEPVWKLAVGLDCFFLQYSIGSNVAAQSLLRSISY